MAVKIAKSWAISAAGEDELALALKFKAEESAAAFSQRLQSLGCEKCFAAEIPELHTEYEPSFLLCDWAAKKWSAFEQESDIPEGTLLLVATACGTMSALGEYLSRVMPQSAEAVDGITGASRLSADTEEFSIPHDLLGAALRLRFLSALGDSAKPLLNSATVMGACASATLALGMAQRLIDEGHVPAALVLALDTVSDLNLVGFDCLKITSEKLNPFAEERQGLILGEGAALIYLTPASAGELSLLSSAFTSDATHLTSPDPSGFWLAEAGKQAMGFDSASDLVSPKLLAVHGTGTISNDVSEYRAIELCFAEQLPKVYAQKGALGHTLGCGGAFETLATLKILESGDVPAWDRSEDSLLPLEVRSAGKIAQGSRALKWSSAFGGLNAALLLGPNHSIEALKRPQQFKRSVRTEWREYGEQEVPWSLIHPERWQSGVSSERFARLAAEQRAVLLLAEEVLLNVARQNDTVIVLRAPQANLAANTRFLRPVLSRGRSGAFPARFPATSANLLASYVSLAFSLHGAALVIAESEDSLPTAYLAAALAPLGGSLLEIELEQELDSALELRSLKLRASYWEGLASENLAS